MYADYLRTISRQGLEIEQAIGDIGAGVGRRFMADALALWQLFCAWQQRAQDRRRLTDMAAHRLDDIGISRDAADREAGKAFWRP